MHTPNRFDELRQEAKAAAAAGRNLEDACPWPFDGAEGRYFKQEFVMHKAALAALGADDKTLTPD